MSYTNHWLIRQPQPERLLRLKLAERYYIIAALQLRLAGHRLDSRFRGDFGVDVEIMIRKHQIPSEFPSALFFELDPLNRVELSLADSRVSRAD